jgi:hypothetical protein
VSYALTAVKALMLSNVRFPRCVIFIWLSLNVFRMKGSLKPSIMRICGLMSNGGGGGEGRIILA